MPPSRFDLALVGMPQKEAENTSALWPMLLWTVMSLQPPSAYEYPRQMGLPFPLHAFTRLSDDAPPLNAVRMNLKPL